MCSPIWITGKPNSANSSQSPQDMEGRRAGPLAMETLRTVRQEAGPLLTPAGLTPHHISRQTAQKGTGMGRAGTMDAGRTGTPTLSSQLPVLPTAQAPPTKCLHSGLSRGGKQSIAVTVSLAGNRARFGILRTLEPYGPDTDPSSASDLLCGLGQVTALSEPRYSHF